MEKKLRLSQCMIVKDEEENIERALSWGKSIVSEQIVVDTGSTDRTVELAKSMGAQVYHFDWIDDFAAAKNYAIEQATGDWIAFLDADEYIKDLDVAKILLLLKQAESLGCCAVQVDMFSVDTEENITNCMKKTRFFKRMPRLRYEGRIHEDLVLTGERQLGKYQMGTEGQVTIYHTGYAPEVIDKKKKHERNYRLLLKHLEQYPGDYHAMGDMGDHYMSLAAHTRKKNETAPEDLAYCYQEAEYWYRKAADRIPKNREEQCERSVKTFLRLLGLMCEQGNDSEAVRVYDEIQSQFIGVYDADYLLGKYYAEKKKDYQTGGHHLERALQILEQHGTGTYGPKLVKELPEAWELLALCSYKNRNLRNCVSLCVGLLRADRSRQSTLELLLWAFAAEAPQSIVQFLEKIYDFTREDEKEIVREACKAAGADEVLRLL